MRPHGVDLEVRVVDGDVDVLGLGQHGHGRRGGVDAPLRLRIGDPLHPVDPALELEPGENAPALHLGHDLPVAAGRALALGEDLHLPALQVRVAGVHAQEIAREQGRLVPAGPGADLEDGALLVRLVLGQEHEPQALDGPLEILARPGHLVMGESPHLRSRDPPAIA